MLFVDVNGQWTLQLILFVHLKLLSHLKLQYAALDKHVVQGCLFEKNQWSSCVAILVI